MELAVRDFNAKGGVLGHKVEMLLRTTRGIRWSPLGRPAPSFSETR